MVHSLYANPELGGSTGHCQPITYQNKEEHIYYNQSLTYNKNTTTLHRHEKVNTRDVHYSWPDALNLFRPIMTAASKQTELTSFPISLTCHILILHNYHI